MEPNELEVSVETFPLFTYRLPDLPEPYNQTDILPFDPHGWYGNAAPIEEIIRTRPISVVIEVGSWLGTSTRHIASLLPPNGKVYAVDHWQGSSEHQVGQFAHYPAVAYLYQQFLSNVIHAGLTDKIVPVRMPSTEASQTLKVKPDLIYIDASHETELVLQDLYAWYPLVRGHGILCGDDWDWNSVRAAVEQFAIENNLKIQASGSFWQLVDLL